MERAMSNIVRGNPASPEDTTGVVDSLSLRLEWAEAPWDSAIFGFPVLQITRMEVLGSSASDDLTIFEGARDRLSAGMVSCRISHECLKARMLLEKHGFRFMEMVYIPELEEFADRSINDQSSLEARVAEAKDLPVLQDIAGSAFIDDRFHIDPRLDSRLGDERYRRWVQSSFAHPRQRLYVVCDGECRVAFFVTELLDDGSCYWHLTAVAPAIQGKGYGRQAWHTMLSHAKEAGAKKVRTCISARNHRALNLYARLGFYFPPPLMTFHWVRQVQL
jgi:RimJ/RimL family protein N-acetyltransferase